MSQRIKYAIKIRGFYLEGEEPYELYLVDARVPPTDYSQDYPIKTFDTYDEALEAASYWKPGAARVVEFDEVQYRKLFEAQDEILSAE